MAAVEPSMSPERQKPPEEDVGVCEKSLGAEESAGTSPRDEEAPVKSVGTPDHEPGASGIGDGTLSNPDVGVESATGADKTAAVSMEETAEAPNSNKRDFDWSEPEDDEGEEKTRTEEAAERDTRDCTNSAEETQLITCNKDIISKPEEVCDETAPLDNDKRTTDTSSVEDLMGEVDRTEDVAEDEDEDEMDQGDGADSPSKQSKSRLVCKECGKRFTRRETFNLHRHFHAHEDDLTPLTCKECGLTFEHRSSLIKHRNEHKEKEEQLISPKKEVQAKEEGTFHCAGCRRIFNTVYKLRDHNCSNTAEKPYHCPLCRQEFQFRVSVTKHIMSHSQESIFSCQECSQTFPNASALRLHQRCHSALKPYECPECGMVFKHYSIMEDHRRRHIDNTRSHLCNVCGKSFKYSSLLHQHQYLHTGQKPFRCPECGKTFAFAQNMKAHCRQHRLHKFNSCSEQLNKQAPVSVQEANVGPGKENTNQNEEPNRAFTCPLCPQSFCTPANLRAHMLIHEAEHETLEKTLRPPKENNKHWETGHTCPHCPCVYRDESSLNKHLLSVHKALAYLEKLAAPPKVIPVLQLPVNHDDVQTTMKSETPSVKTYKCSECEKTFRHRSVLELHMRIHSKDRPYQCKVCGKGFRFSSYLQQHIIIHTGKKPYKCPDCGKDFAFLQNMKTHQKLHQEKPFRCTSCRKGYSDEAQLQQHMLSHNGDKPHKCNQCDKSFGLAYLLRDHMNTHTGERPHRCEECHKTFSWFSSLLVHQKIHARKRQGFNQCNTFQSNSRMRGRGNRGKRGGRLTLGWSRTTGASGTTASHQPLYDAPTQRDAEVQQTTQSLSSIPAACLDSQSVKQKESWMSKMNSQPVRWKVDGGEVMPFVTSQPQHGAPQQTQPETPVKPGVQRGAGRADVSQSGSNSVQSLNLAHVKESTSSVSSVSAPLPNKSSPLTGSEVTQHRQHKVLTWSSTPTSSTVLASTSSGQLAFTAPPYGDGAALWSVRPAVLVNSQNSSNVGQELKLSRWAVAPVQSQKDLSAPPTKEGTAWDLSNAQAKPSTVSHPEKPGNGSEPQKPRVSGLVGAPTSVKVDQSNAIPISASVSLGVGSTLWDIKTPPGIPKTINSTEKIVKNPDFQPSQNQVSSGWANVQTATQKVPISIQYEPSRFGQGVGTPIWGFQSTAVGAQTLLTGQLKPGTRAELHAKPMVTGTQIIINQPSFLSAPIAPLPPLALPGPQPLRSVAVGTLPRPSHPKIFFTPQTVVSDRPHIPQTLPLPQLAQLTETNKLATRLPFPPERLLQCMICGRTLPRELDLQMHYLQHAQGEI